MQTRALLIVPAFLCLTALPAAAKTSPLEQGIQSILSGEFADAVELLAPAAAQKPKDAVLHYHLGVAYKGLADFQRATQEFAQAARLASRFSGPLRSQAEWGLALSYEELGNCEAARGAWMRYLSASAGDGPGVAQIARQHIQACPLWPVNVEPERYPRYR